MKDRFKEIAKEVAHECAHMSSAALVSKRNVLNYEDQEIEIQVAALTAAIARARERQKRLDAIRSGLNIILTRRQS